jgi:ADP-heptose:LPS heptosyltransferase
MKILLLQLKRIGDLILTTPAIAALQEKFPGARSTLVIAPECAELLPAISGIERSLVVRRNLRDLALFFAIAREKFDCCIDFTQNDRSALLTFLSRAQTRVVSSRVKAHATTRARIYNQFADARLKEMHTLDYNLALLKPLGIGDAAPSLHLEAPMAAHDKARELLRRSKIDNPFIVFHPGSARAEKFWEPQRWADVIEHARRQWRVNTVITGGKWSFEQEHIGEIQKKLAAEGGASRNQQAAGSVVDLSGQTDLLTLAALIAQARLLVTVDSAAMHLAAAQGTPQVALFGPTNPFHWRPRQSPALILYGESSVPVSEFLPKQERLPMKQVSTEAVFNAMDSLLSAPAAQFS